MLDVGDKSVRFRIRICQKKKLITHSRPKLQTNNSFKKSVSKRINCSINYVDAYCRIRFCAIKIR